MRRDFDYDAFEAKNRRKYPDLYEIFDKTRGWLDEHEIAQGREAPSEIARRRRERVSASQGEGQRVVGAEVHSPGGQAPIEPVKAEVLDSEGKVIRTTQARLVRSEPASRADLTVDEK
jgi:hypothetical protein